MLYVDDEDDVREVFQAVFEGDFDVSLAPNGGAALDALARSPVDVLVSDMRMESDEGQCPPLARAFERAPGRPAHPARRVTATTTTWPTR